MAWSFLLLHFIIVATEIDGRDFPSGLDLVVTILNHQE
jgi:hypothetical protein